MVDVKGDTVLIYMIEGEPATGNLKMWARAMENAHYSGYDVPPVVWVAERLSDNDASGKLARFHELKPEQYGRSAYDDYVTYYYKLGEQEATVRIDGRA